jgi:actin-like protein 6A
LFWQVIKLDLTGITDTYKSYWQRAIVADIKEIVCHVPDTALDGNDYFLLCMSVVKES